MGRRLATPVGLALLVALAVGPSGCGGGDSTREAETTRDPLAGYPKGPTRQFIEPGADNAVQEFGREATAAEREYVSKLVKAWLRARVRAEWARACSYLHEKNTEDAIEMGSMLTGEPITSCAKGLSALARNPETPRNNIKGGVASLRIEAGQGYAQYHGKEGRDWILAVRREGRRWKIAHFYPIERFK